MAYIVDFGVVAAAQIVALIEGIPDFGQQSLLELVIYFLLHIHVVNSYARLPAIHVLPKHNSLHCAIHVRTLIHYHWALSPQLKDTGRQIFGSLYRDQSAGFSGASKADDIELEFGQRFGHLHPALDDSVES